MQEMEHGMKNNFVNVSLIVLNNLNYDKFFIKSKSQDFKKNSNCKISDNMTNDREMSLNYAKHQERNMI